MFKIIFLKPQIKNNKINVLVMKYQKKNNIKRKVKVDYSKFLFNSSHNTQLRPSFSYPI